MSSRWTISLSVEQMYCCFSRLLHLLWSRLNEMLADACVAANSFTGIATNPKAIVAPALARRFHALGAPGRQRDPRGVPRALRPPAPQHRPGTVPVHRAGVHGHH